jgi:hypothetical protein
MKPSILSSMTAFLLMGTSAIFLPTHAQEADSVDVFGMCKKETNHAKLYEYGKKLAEGWVYRLKTEAKEEKKNPVKTKYSFFVRSFVGYADKSKMTQADIVYACYSGYNSNLMDVAWSSVHQGLVDYLPPQSKSKFLSLPER